MNPRVVRSERSKKQGGSFIDQGAIAKLNRVWSTLRKTKRLLHKGMALARISHKDKRIGAENQRKLFCENDFSMIRRRPRCRQSVAQNGLILESLKGGLWTQRSMPGW
jgi:hypothetical protein